MAFATTGGRDVMVPSSITVFLEDGDKNNRTATHVTPRHFSKPFANAGATASTADDAAPASRPMAGPPTAKITASQSISSPSSKVTVSGGDSLPLSSTSLRDDDTTDVTLAPPRMVTLRDNNASDHGSKIRSAMGPRHHRTSKAPRVRRPKTWKQDRVAAAEMSYPGAMGNTCNNGLTNSSYNSFPTPALSKNKSSALNLSYRSHDALSS
mmetsp:Transcript_41124/g.50057  ORF Transcript_41124/g.50057 Transcript_41124/m.50057 type:complete len:210 (+) Transcript_41124:686-1315(+)